MAIAGARSREFDLGLRQPGVNWGGTHRYGAHGLFPAHTVDDVIRAVNQPGPVRALGTRHSFNDIADTTGTLVTVTDFDPQPEIDAAAGTVTVSAGTSYGVLARYLQRRGWALHNTGSLPHISIGGATALGTHGSGNALGNLSTAVRALEVVAADGSVRHIDKDDEHFEGHVIALGALGIVVRITLAIEPSYDVRQDVYCDLSWESVLDDVPAVMGSAYSVSLFTDWVTDAVSEAWLKTRLDHALAPPATVAGAVRQEHQVRGATEGEDSNLTVQGGIPGPWSERLPHFRLDATPSHGNEIQSEYFVELTRAADALCAVRALGTVIAPQLLVSELRSVAADQLWMSPSYERDVLGLHFTWRNEPRAVKAILPRIEEALSPFEARPHWGKAQTAPMSAVAKMYPRISDFRRLVIRWDPEGRFLNDRMRQLMG